MLILTNNQKQQTLPGIPPPATTAYDLHRERMARRVRRQSRSAREIGPLPAVVDQARRDACQGDLIRFAKTYHAPRFNLKWSRDHVETMQTIQRAILAGGLFAWCQPRGSGKTTQIEVATEWAICYGHRRYIAIVGSDDPAAGEIAASIVVDFETNALLIADFPEICYPVARLEGIAQRAAGQTLGGIRTRMQWTAHGRKIVFPTVADSPSSGAVIQTAGITGRIRGMKHALTTGENIRPDFALVDDPQTDDSARSVDQNTKREKVIKGAVLGLAGPGKPIACCIPCTIIEPDDLACRLTDRVRNPDFQGRRYHLVDELPKRSDLWEQYTELYRDEMATAGQFARATAFYKKNRKAMDEGAVVPWSDRYNPPAEISALQHAMNLRARDPHSFEREFQQSDDQEQSADLVRLTAKQIRAQRLNKYNRGALPPGCRLVTAGVDCHARLLYWCLAAWSDRFDGFVLDYGTYPEQRTRSFTMKTATRPITRAHPTGGVEDRLRAALSALLSDLANRTWSDDHGDPVTPGQILVDAGWQKEAVYETVATHPRRAIILPAHGRGIRAGQTPIDDWRLMKGETAGHRWRRRRKNKTVKQSHVMSDVNYWKSFVHDRLATPVGDPGGLTLYGQLDNRAARVTHHTVFADHLTAEQSTTQTYGSRKVEEWKIPSNKPDNHWFDCLVAATIAASMKGAGLAAHKPAKRRKRFNVTYHN